MDEAAAIAGALRLQQWAGAGETVMSGPTMAALSVPVAAAELAPATVKGRAKPVQAYKIGVQALTE